MKPRRPLFRFVNEYGPGPWIQCSQNTPIGLDIDMSVVVERIQGDFFLEITGDGNIEHLHEWFAATEGILIDAPLAQKDGVISSEHFSERSNTSVQDTRDLKKHSGATTGKHLFGDMGSLFDNGFVKLQLHDENHDGQIKGGELEGLAVWADRNSNVKVDAGELSTLVQYGIVALRTSHDKDYVSSAQLVDGSTMITEDLWFMR